MLKFVVVDRPRPTAVSYMWQRVSAAEYRNGEIRMVLGPDHKGRHCWHYQIRIGNTWKNAWVKSRPWGYGSGTRPSSLCGFHQIKEFIYE